MLFIIHFFITIFLSLINLMINKYTSYIIVLESWNTAARKHPAERKKWPALQKRLKNTALSGKQPPPPQLFTQMFVRT